MTDYPDSDNDVYKRPHPGYIFLRMGETAKPGDEFYQWGLGPWLPVTKRTYLLAGHSPHRRKVADEIVI
jgi:hypothetical protein